MSVQEIETAVSSLSPEELESFSKWFEVFLMKFDCGDDVGAERFAELQAKLQVGIDQLDRGEGIPWDLDKFLARARSRRAARNGDAS